MPDRTITFLTAKDSLEPVAGLVGVLVECAPDARWLPRGSVAITELLGPWQEAKRSAAELVEELLVDEPEIDGVRHMYALKEIFIRAAMQQQLALHLDGWLKEHGVTRCVFRSHSDIAGSLGAVQALTGSDYTIESPNAERRSKFQAAREYLTLKGSAGIRDLPWLAAQRLFPIKSRMRQRHSAGPFNKGDWWYYSTAYTFTNIGLAYERGLGRQFRFITELRGGAEKPLQEKGRDWDELYSYSEEEDAPMADEIGAERRRLQEHLERAATRHASAKALLLRSHDLELFFSRLLPLTMLQTRVLRRWLEKTEPALVVVGNEAWEGCLLQLAGARGTPTVILQHGIFGDYYQFTEHSSDVILARGEFWREFLSERSRKKSAVVNCESARTEIGRAAGDDLLFVTTDYRAQTYWHTADLADMLTVAATAAFEAQRRLVIRIHPRDSAEPYRNLLERICNDRGIAPEIEYSSGPGLEDVIQKSAVALLHYSTVFLDCLRYGIPIVSPGWQDFAFKEMARKHQVFNFALDLNDLHRLLGEGLKQRLKSPANYEQFLAPTSSEELRTFFNSHARARTTVG